MMEAPVRRSFKPGPAPEFLFFGPKYALRIDARLSASTLQIEALELSPPPRWARA
jgi:hypothetical protein